MLSAFSFPTLNTTLLTFSLWFIFFILLTILVILCHANLHFSEALVPIIEHKPQAEAIPVLNREKLVSCVLRLMLLLIYLNI